ncbi:hypothetical protein DIPPA_30116 [Diplonema papillatum]|nr:hypothetical protein DIPPA_30116 [Diplonema papillatum]
MTVHACSDVEELVTALYKARKGDAVRLRGVRVEGEALKEVLEAAKGSEIGEIALVDCELDARGAAAVLRCVGGVYPAGDLNGKVAVDLSNNYISGTADLATFNSFLAALSRTAPHISSIDLSHNPLSPIDISLLTSLPCTFASDLTSGSTLLATGTVPKTPFFAVYSSLSPPIDTLETKDIPIALDAVIDGLPPTSVADVTLFDTELHGQQPIVYPCDVPEENVSRPLCAGDKDVIRGIKRKISQNAAHALGLEKGRQLQQQQQQETSSSSQASRGTGIDGTVWASELVAHDDSRAPHLSLQMSDPQQNKLRRGPTAGDERVWASERSADRDVGLTATATPSPEASSDTTAFASCRSGGSIASGGESSPDEHQQLAGPPTAWGSPYDLKSGSDNELSFSTPCGFSEQQHANSENPSTPHNLSSRHNKPSFSNPYGQQRHASLERAGMSYLQPAADNDTDSKRRVHSVGSGSGVDSTSEINLRSESRDAASAHNYRCDVKAPRASLAVASLTADSGYAIDTHPPPFPPKNRRAEDRDARARNTDQPPAALFRRNLDWAQREAADFKQHDEEGASRRGVDHRRESTQTHTAERTDADGFTSRRGDLPRPSSLPEEPPQPPLAPGDTIRPRACAGIVGIFRRLRPPDSTGNELPEPATHRTEASIPSEKVTIHPETAASGAAKLVTRVVKSGTAPTDPSYPGTSHVVEGEGSGHTAINHDYETGNDDNQATTGDTHEANCDGEPGLTPSDQSRSSGSSHRGIRDDWAHSAKEGSNPADVMHHRQRSAAVECDAEVSSHGAPGKAVRSDATGGGNSHAPAHRLRRSAPACESEAFPCSVSALARSPATLQKENSVYKQPPQHGADLGCDAEALTAAGAPAEPHSAVSHSGRPVGRRYNGDSIQSFLQHEAMCKGSISLGDVPTMQPADICPKPSLRRSPQRERSTVSPRPTSSSPPPEQKSSHHVDDSFHRGSPKARSAPVDSKYIPDPVYPDSLKLHSTAVDFLASRNERKLPAAEKLDCSRGALEGDACEVLRRPRDKFAPSADAPGDRYPARLTSSPAPLGLKEGLLKWHPPRVCAVRAEQCSQQSPSDVKSTQTFCRSTSSPVASRFRRSYTDINSSRVNAEQCGQQLSGDVRNTSTFCRSSSSPAPSRYSRSFVNRGPPHTEHRTTGQVHDEQQPSTASSNAPSTPLSGILKHPHPGNGTPVQSPHNPHRHVKIASPDTCRRNQLRDYRERVESKPSNNFNGYAGIRHSTDSSLRYERRNHRDIPTPSQPQSIGCRSSNDYNSPAAAHTVTATAADVFQRNERRGNRSTPTPSRPQFVGSRSPNNTNSPAGLFQRELQVDDDEAPVPSQLQFSPCSSHSRETESRSGDGSIRVGGLLSPRLRDGTSTYSASEVGRRQGRAYPEFIQGNYRSSQAHDVDTPLSSRRTNQRPLDSSSSTQNDRVTSNAPLPHKSSEHNANKPVRRSYSTQGTQHNHSSFNASLPRTAAGDFDRHTTNNAVRRSLSTQNPRVPLDSFLHSNTGMSRDQDDPSLGKNTGSVGAQAASYAASGTRSPRASDMLPPHSQPSNTFGERTRTSHSIRQNYGASSNTPLSARYAGEFNEHRTRNPGLSDTPRQPGHAFDEHSKPGHRIDQDYSASFFTPLRPTRKLQTSDVGRESRNTAPAMPRGPERVDPGQSNGCRDADLNDSGDDDVTTVEEWPSIADLIASHPSQPSPRRKPVSRHGVPSSCRTPSKPAEAAIGSPPTGTIEGAAGVKQRPDGPTSFSPSYPATGAAADLESNRFLAKHADKRGAAAAKPEQTRDGRSRPGVACSIPQHRQQEQQRLQYQQMQQQQEPLRQQGLQHKQEQHQPQQPLRQQLYQQQQQQPQRQCDISDSGTPDFTRETTTRQSLHKTLESNMPRRLPSDGPLDQWQPRRLPSDGPLDQWQPRRLPSDGPLDQWQHQLNKRVIVASLPSDNTSREAINELTSTLETPKLWITQSDTTVPPQYCKKRGIVVTAVAPGLSFEVVLENCNASASFACKLRLDGTSFAQVTHLPPRTRVRVSKRSARDPLLLPCDGRAPAAGVVLCAAFYAAAAARRSSFDLSQPPHSTASVVLVPEPAAAGSFRGAVEPPPPQRRRAPCSAPRSASAKPARRPRASQRAAGPSAARAKSLPFQQFQQSRVAIAVCAPSFANKLASPRNEQQRPSGFGIGT